MTADQVIKLDEPQVPDFQNLQMMKKELRNQLTTQLRSLLDLQNVEDADVIFNALEEFGEFEPIVPDISEFAFLRPSGIYRMTNLYRSRKSQAVTWRSLYLRLVEFYTEYILFFEALDKCNSENSRTFKAWEPFRNVQHPIYFVTREMLQIFLNLVVEKGTKGFMLPS